MSARIRFGNARREGRRTSRGDDAPEPFDGRPGGDRQPAGAGNPAACPGLRSTWCGTSGARPALVGEVEGVVQEVQRASARREQALPRSACGRRTRRLGASLPPARAGVSISGHRQGGADALPRGMGCVAPVYRPRDAEHTVLHQVIALHLEAFLEAVAAGHNLRVPCRIPSPRRPSSPTSPAPPRGRDKLRRAHDRLPCSLPLLCSVRARHVLKEARQHETHDVRRHRGPLLGGVRRDTVHDWMRRPEDDPLQRWSVTGPACA